MRKMVWGLLVFVGLSFMLFLTSCNGGTGTSAKTLRVHNLLYSVSTETSEYYENYNYEMYIDSIEVDGLASPLIIGKIVDLNTEFDLDVSFDITGNIEGSTLVINTGGLATFTTSFPTQVEIPEKLEGVVHHLESGMLKKGWSTYQSDEVTLNLYFDISNQELPSFFAITSPTTTVELDLGLSNANATVTVEIPSFLIHSSVSASPVSWKGVRVADVFGTIRLNLPQPQDFGSYTIRFTYFEGSTEKSTELTVGD
ncbi:MAG: hypothetical protein PWP37_1015 [Thermotogota bacterium]|nr:hypothetical protein [Thermotogota bacterium]MDK2864823.1 hypothetical protein [Thermotogota bacterium]HCZ06463.1 hypothetical protein [Thermotogota bacterium]